MSELHVRNPKTKITAFLDENGNVKKLITNKKDWNGLNKSKGKKQLATEKTTTTVDETTGAVLDRNTEYETWSVAESEPNFVKIYLADLSKLKDLPKGHEQLLFQLFGLVGYNNVIAINATIKKMISEKINIKPRTIDKYLSNLVEQEILYRAGLGTYIFNPILVAKGQWKDIRKLRLSIEYSIDSNGNVISKEISADKLESNNEAPSETTDNPTKKKRGRPRKKIS